MAALLDPDAELQRLTNLKRVGKRGERPRYSFRVDIPTAINLISDIKSDSSNLSDTVSGILKRYYANRDSNLLAVELHEDDTDLLRRTAKCLRLLPEELAKRIITEHLTDYADQAVKIDQRKADAAAALGGQSQPRRK